MSSVAVIVPRLSSPCPAIQPPKDVVVVSIKTLARFRQGGISDDKRRTIDAGTSLCGSNDYDRTL